MSYRSVVYFGSSDFLFRKLAIDFCISHDKTLSFPLFAIYRIRIISKKAKKVNFFLKIVLKNINNCVIMCLNKAV
jgi:hypothetical protein